MTNILTSKWILLEYYFFCLESSHYRLHWHDVDNVHSIFHSSLAFEAILKISKMYITFRKIFWKNLKNKSGPKLLLILFLLFIRFQCSFRRVSYFVHIGVVCITAYLTYYGGIYEEMYFSALVLNIQIFSKWNNYDGWFYHEFSICVCPSSSVLSLKLRRRSLNQRWNQNTTIGATRRRRQRVGDG